MQDFWTPLQKIIADVCLNFDKTWQVRKRVITTQFLVLVIFKLVLSKNRQGYKSLLTEIWESPEISAFQNTPVAASSLCEARQKMPEEIFLELNRAVLAAREAAVPLPLWCGLRVFGVDGSKLNLPHELLSEGYRAPNVGQYYPQELLSTVYHLGSGLIYDCMLADGGKGERSCVIEQMDKLSKEDVLVLDRGYFSYLLLDKALEKGVHLICRLQSGNMNAAVKTFWDSELTDVVVDYKPSGAVKSEIKKQGHTLFYSTIRLRLIKYKIDGETYICATTLIGEQYPSEEFPRVYHGRWGIEELYKISKEFIDVEDFHSKTERGVKQELYGHALLINIGRIFESEANRQMPPSSKPEKPEKQKAENAEIKEGYWQDFIGKIQQLKVNFKNCLLVIGRVIEKLLVTAEKEKDWLSQILSSISRVRQKLRPGRHFPRQSRKPYTKWQNINAAKLAKA